jgi:hypothetical protein
LAWRGVAVLLAADLTAVTGGLTRYRVGHYTTCGGGVMTDTAAKLIEDRTCELVEAYRGVRREIDASGYFERMAAIVYLVDSSELAFNALVAKHSVPQARDSLKEVHDAFAAEDLLHKANIWRKQGFAIVSAIFGITAISVLILAISVIGKAVSESRSIIAAGGGLALVFLAGQTMKVGYDSYCSSKQLSSTEKKLRPFEERYFQVVGGSPSNVNRVDLLRVAGALANASFTFVFGLLILILLWVWLPSHLPHVPSSPVTYFPQSP